jgi:hypothetical protein
VASHAKLPRISEKIASKTLGKLAGVTNPFSNFKAFRKRNSLKIQLERKRNVRYRIPRHSQEKRLKIGELNYDLRREERTRESEVKTKANLRIIWALLKSFHTLPDLPHFSALLILS